MNENWYPTNNESSVIIGYLNIEMCLGEVLISFYCNLLDSFASIIFDSIFFISFTVPY